MNKATIVVGGVPLDILTDGTFIQYEGRYYVARIPGMVRVFSHAKHETHPSFEQIRDVICGTMSRTNPLSFGEKMTYDLAGDGWRLDYADINCGSYETAAHFIDQMKEFGFVVQYIGA